MTGRPISEDDLQAYVDDALDESRRGEVVFYLRRHLEADLRVESYRMQRDILRAALAPVAEEPLPAEMDLARMMEAHRRASLAPWRRRAVALLIFSAGALAGWSLHVLVDPVPAGIAALAREAGENYDVYAPDLLQPVELGVAERTTLVEWISKRFSRPVTVPDLTTFGFDFMGGRLVATGHGPAVLFMYEDEAGTRLVMLSRPMRKDADAPLEQHSHGSIVGFAWADGGMGHSLVGHVPLDVMKSVAEEARRQLAKI
ncbi:MAG: anti-sigma factor [Rhodospirillales bacterium]|nr:anti-sigma factor [Rhodospirillales bacterium]